MLPAWTVHSNRLLPATLLMFAAAYFSSRHSSGAIAGYRRALALSGLWFGTAMLAQGQCDSTPREQDVEAALLFNFTQFVEWPPDAFPSAEAPVIIGILGRDPFGETLDKLAAAQPPEARRVIIARYSDPKTVSRCHVLFISSSERDNLQQIFAAIERRPILTVSDLDGFLRRGGILQFFRGAEARVRVRVNLRAVRASALTISAKLLRVVEIESADQG